MANPQPVISETKHLKSTEFRGPIEIVHRVVETEVICSESVTITVRKQSLQDGSLTDEEEVGDRLCLRLQVPVYAGTKFVRCEWFEIADSPAGEQLAGGNQE